MLTKLIELIGKRIKAKGNWYSYFGPPWPPARRAYASESATALIIYHQIIMLYENECVSTAFTNPVWARDFGFNESLAKRMRLCRVSLNPFYKIDGIHPVQPNNQ